MTMKRYIDADDLISECEEDIVDYDEDLQKHFIVKAVPTEYIEAFPGADVEEVRHGKWVYIGDPNYAIQVGFLYECSCCKRHITVNYQFELKDYPYCHCGAKMDEKENDNNEH